MHSRIDRERTDRVLDGLFLSWQRAEQRYRELPSGSPDAERALAEVGRLWVTYEKALGKVIGQGSLGRPPDRA